LETGGTVFGFFLGVGAVGGNVADGGAELTAAAAGVVSVSLDPGVQPATTATSAAKQLTVARCLDNGGSRIFIRGIALPSVGLFFWGCGSIAENPHGWQSDPTDKIHRIFQPRLPISSHI
jgi:hypothetical protein